MKNRTEGPQLEGFTETWLRDAFDDVRTKLLDLGEEIKWPLLTPIEHNHDYRKDFFDEHFPNRPAYYLSLPSQETLENRCHSVANISEIFDIVRGENGIIAHDFLENGDTVDPLNAILEDIGQSSKLELRDITPVSQGFGMTYGKPAVAHFEAVASQQDKWPLGDFDVLAAFARLSTRGEVKTISETGATVLTKENLLANDSQLLDEIWAMYHGQFDELVNDHPSLQIQPREELESMLLDDESFNIAYTDNGQVKALCYFVSTIEKAIWLNPEFFAEIKSTAPGVRLAYFPGIVVDKGSARQGAGYVDEMIRLIEKVYEEAGMRGMQIVFQCTNISETYIPKIVTNVISQNGVFVFERPADEAGSSFRETARYSYHILEVDQLS